MTTPNNDVPPREAARGGRPPALDDEAKGVLVIALAAGLTQREAAAWAGCSQSTVWYLLQNDAGFASELTYYMRFVRLQPHLCIYRAAGKSWKGAVCLIEHLQRRHRELSTDDLFAALQLAFDQVGWVRYG